MPKASQKTLHRAKDETTEEKEVATGNGEGGARGLPNYFPMGEYRSIQEVYVEWLHSSNVLHLSEDIQDNTECQTR